MRTIRLSSNLAFTNQVKLINGEVYYQIKCIGSLKIPLLGGFHVPVTIGCIGGWVGKNTIIDNSWVRNDSSIANSTAENAMIKNSTIRNAVIEESSLYECNVSNSTIVRSNLNYATLSNANIYNSYNINHNGIHSTELKLKNNVTVEDSRIQGRWIEVSDNVIIRNSEIDRATIIKDGSLLQDTRLQQGSYISSSSLDNCELVKPHLTNCILKNQNDLGYYDKPLFREITRGVRAF